ncbi:trans-aconitate 2-methyltransferase [Ferrovibrio sp.]|uniref:class I SAM-dependent methyltransferase n=1 Tax=Ferrovibrio sp. TaxID=1917215 RepID=UPI0035ADE5C1
MSDLDLTPVAELYTNSLREHGFTPKGVGWRDEESQALRFDKLISVIELEAGRKPISVCELGCGYGALVTHLIDRGIPVSSFDGYDISLEMLTAARQYLAGKDWCHLHGDSSLQREADYAFTSGIFNVRIGVDEKEWIAYIEKVILNLNASSRRGFAFNLLSTYVDFRADKLFYGDPGYFFDFCKRNCSRFVTLHHDYPLYEWTITVRK